MGAIAPEVLARLSRYTPEELDPRVAEDEAAMEAYIERNRDAINKALEEGYTSLNAGAGTEIRSLEDLLSALSAAKRSRSFPVWGDKDVTSKARPTAIPSNRG